MFGSTISFHTVQRAISLVVLASLLLATPLTPAAVAAPAAGRDVRSPEAVQSVASEAPQAVTWVDPGPWNQQIPFAAADSAGNLHLVWRDSREGSDRAHIRYAYRPAGSNWSASVKLDPTSTSSQGSPAIAVDGSGNAYAIWQDDRSGVGQIYFAYRPVGGSWGASQVISPTTQIQAFPALAVNRRGEAAVAWRQGTGSTYDVYYALRPAGGAWGAAQRKTAAAGNFRGIAIALDDWGRLSLAWEDWSQWQIRFAQRSPEGTWGADENIRDTTTGGTWGPKIAVDGAGNVHAVWEDYRSLIGIYAAYRPAGGRWSVNVRLVAGNDMWSPDLKVDGAGNAIAVWSRMMQEVYGAVYHRGSGWWPGRELIPWPPRSAAALAEGEDDPGERDLEEGGQYRPARPAGGLGLTSNPPSVGDSSLFFGFPNSIGGKTYSNIGGYPLKIPVEDMVRVSTHAGNGSEQPPVNADGGAYPPSPALSSGSGYAIAERDMDGQTVFVVQAGNGKYGIFTDKGDAEHFANQNAVPQAPAPPAAPPAAGEPPPNQQAGGEPPPAEPPPTPPGQASNQPPPTEPPAAPLTPPEEEPPKYTRSVAALYAEFQSHWSEAAKAANEGNWEGMLRALATWEAWNKKLGPVEKEDVEPLKERVWKSLVGARSDLEDEIRRSETKYNREMLKIVSETKPGNITIEEALENPSQVLPEEALTRIRAALETHEERVAPLRNELAKTNYIAGALLYTVQVITPEERYKWMQEFGSPMSSWVDPILPHSGEFIHSETPLAIPGRGLDYRFSLIYRSQLVYIGPVGWSWQHNYDRRVVATGGGSLGLQDGAGLTGVFSFDGTTLTPSAGRFTAVISATTGITLTDQSGIVEGYFPLGSSATAGRLRSISDRNGNTLRFAYDARGQLQTVTDTLGRIVTYAYDARGRIATVTDFSGRVVRLGYDANGDLVSLTTPAVTGTPNGNDFPQGKTTRFAYTAGFSDQRLNHNLTTIISPNEVADGSLTPRTINTYGTEGLNFDRVISQSWGGGRSNASGVVAGGNVTFTYSTAITASAPAGAYSKTTITDRGGNVLEVWHDGAGHRLRDRQVVDGQALVTDYSYNADGLMTRVTYPAGNRIEYRYDDGAANRLAQGNLLEVRRVADATRGCPSTSSGSTSSGQVLELAACPALVTTYSYTTSLQLLSTLTDPLGNMTRYSYDARGNLTQVRFPTVTLGVTTPQVAVESWTYNTFGQPLTYTDPEGKVTRYEYYASGPATGYRQRVIRDSGGLNIATAYTYDAVGNVTSVTDGRGVRTDYVVNALNQVVKVTRAATGVWGQESELSTEYGIRNTEYTARNTASATTALGYETLYWYDANDNLVRVDVENVRPDLDADFHPTGTHSRDAANPWWTTTYTYDLLDNRVRQVAEVSATVSVTTEYRYDPLERLAAVTFPAGNRVEYAYDERHQLRWVTQGVGATEVTTTSYTYDANGNLVQVTDGEGHLTDTVYDGFDRPVGRVDALGNVRLWRYDANGNLVETLARDGQDGRNPGRTLNAAGLVTLSRAQSSYDERNRPYAAQEAYFSADVGTGVLTPITADGDGDGWVETAYAYDRNGNLVALTDDRGQTTRYAYNGLGRLTLRTDALNNTIAYSYDGNGNLTQTVATERQPDGLAPTEIFTTTYAYDAANRLAQMTNNLGQTTRYTYDGRDNLVFRSDANGQVTVTSKVTVTSNAHGNTALFAYDGLSRRLSETYHLRAGGLGSGAVTGQVVMAYAYDGNGNLTQRTDPNGNATTYAYDVLNRLTRVTYADGTTTTYTYDRAGNLTRQTDANGNVVTHTYDAADRRTRSDVTRGAGVGGTTLQTFAWDGLGRLVAATDNNDPATAADDSALAFTYDSLGNTRSETQDGRVSLSTYDGLGNRLTLRYPGGTVITTTYDALNRVKTVADAGGNIAAYDYIGPGRLWRRTFGNGTYAAYSYDAVGRLTGIAYRQSADHSLLAGFSYSYDRVGNRLSETAQPGGLITYTYDSLYRLVSVQYPVSGIQYTYDAAGNRTQVVRSGQAISYTANVMNAYTTVNGESRHYDANGNLVEVRQGTAPSRYRLYLPLILRGATPSVMLANLGSFGVSSSAVVTETVTRYHYDFANRLIGFSRTTTVTTGLAAQATTERLTFTYDALGRMVSRQTGSNTVRHLYAGGQVIEDRDGTGTVLAIYISNLTLDRGGNRYFYQVDGLGSTRALVNNAGGVAERVGYDPFGAPVFSGGGSQSAVGNWRLFRGRGYDADNGLYVYGGRRYDPATGRYLQRGSETLGNPYTFNGNNPVQ